MIPFRDDPKPARRHWTIFGAADYDGRPRPVVVVQDAGFDRTDSITVCTFTTDRAEAPFDRLPAEP